MQIFCSCKFREFFEDLFFYPVSLFGVFGFVDGEIFGKVIEEEFAFKPPANFLFFNSMDKLGKLGLSNFFGVGFKGLPLPLATLVVKTCAPALPRFTICPFATLPSP